MMRRYELVDLVKRYNPRCDEALLDKALYIFCGMMATRAPEAGLRRPCLPSLEVAITAEMRMDGTCHRGGTLSTRSRTRDQGEDLTFRRRDRRADRQSPVKLKKLDFVSKRTEQAENFQ